MDQIIFALRGTGPAHLVYNVVLILECLIKGKQSLYSPPFLFHGLPLCNFSPWLWKPPPQKKRQNIGQFTKRGWWGVVHYRKKNFF